MRKILLFIALFSASAFSVGTYDTLATSGKWSVAGTWSGGLPQVNIDTALHKTGTNDTLDSSFALARWRIPPVSGTSWSTAGKSITLGHSLVDSGTGTGRLPDSIFITGTTGFFINALNNGARTGAGVNISFAGITSAMTLHSDPNWKSLTLVSNAKLKKGGSRNLTLSGTPPVLVLGNSTTYTDTTVTTVKPTASGHFMSLGTPAPVLDGTGGLTLSTGATSTNDTVDAVNSTTSALSSYDVFINLAHTGCRIDAVGNIRSAVSMNLTATTGSDATSSINLNFFLDSSATLNYGSTGSGTGVINFNSATLKFTTVTPQNLATTINLGSSSWTVTGNFTLGSTHTVNGGTSTLTKTGATSTRTAPNGKNLGNYTIAKTGNVKDTIPASDTMRTSGSISITSGGLFLPASSYIYDSLNWSRSGTDTSIMLGGKSIGGDFTLAAGIPLNAGGDSVITRFFTANNSTITTNGTAVGRIRIVKASKAATVTLADSLTCRSLRDSVGTLVQNKKLITDSTTYLLDSASLDTTWRAWDSVTIGASAKLKVGSNSDFVFQGGVPGYLAGNSKTLARITIRKTAGVNWTLASGITGTIFTRDSGDIFITKKLVCDSFAINGSDSVVISDTIQCSGSSVISSTAKITFTGVGKIIYTGSGKTSALNGNTSIPPIVILATTNFTGGATINRLSFGVDGIKSTWQTSKKFTFSNIDTANWNGSSGSLDSMISSSANSACTLDFPTNNTYSFMYFRDCKTISPDTLKCPWGQGCRSGGGN